MKNENFSNMNVDALQKEAVACKKKLFELRLDASSMQVKDYSQFKKMRKQVARILTEVRKREMTKG